MKNDESFLNEIMVDLSEVDDKKHRMKSRFLKQLFKILLKDKENLLQAIKLLKNDKTCMLEMGITLTIFCDNDSESASLKENDIGYQSNS